MKKKKYYAYASTRRINRLINELELKIKLFEYSFLSTHYNDVKIYKKLKHQTEFILKYKNHKCKINTK